jgi:hypothetical protein
MNTAVQPLAAASCIRTSSNAIRIVVCVVHHLR